MCTGACKVISVGSGLLKKEGGEIRGSTRDPPIERGGRGVVLRERGQKMKDKLVENIHPQMMPASCGKGPKKMVRNRRRVSHVTTRSSHKTGPMTDGTGSSMEPTREDVEIGQRRVSMMEGGGGGEDEGAGGMEREEDDGRRRETEVSG